MGQWPSTTGGSDGAESADRRLWFEIRRADPGEIWGSHCPSQATEPEYRAGRAIRVDRSQDHAITGPPFQVLPSASFCFPSIHILADLETINYVSGTGDGGDWWKCNKRKWDETLMMRAGHQLRTIEGQCINMIREMATSI